MVETGPSVSQVADHIAGELRRRITAGMLPPGTPLRDATLAAEFEVSRNTVREALRILRHSGLVRHRLHRGVEVTSLDVAAVRDIYAARSALEIRAVQESATASEEAMLSVRHAVESAERSVRDGAWQDVGTASLAYHQTLVGLLGSPSLDEFMATLVARLRLAFAVMHDEAAFQAPWVREDRRIHDLLAAGDRQRAEEALRIYLADSERDLVDVVRGYHAQHGRAADRPDTDHERE